MHVCACEVENECASSARVAILGFAHLLLLLGLCAFSGVVIGACVCVSE